MTPEEYYAQEEARQRVVDALGGSKAMLKHDYDGKPVYRRYDEAGNPIQISSPDEIAEWARKHMTEVHSVYGPEVNQVPIDIDPGEGVPWERVREAAQQVASQMENPSVQFSGGRGFYVRDQLPENVSIEDAKARANQIAAATQEKYPDFVTQPPSENQIRLDTSTLHEGGSLRAPYSYHSDTGLVAAPVAMEDLPTVEREAFEPRTHSPGFWSNDDVSTGVSREDGLYRISKIKTSALAARERVEVFGRKGDKYLTGLFSGQGGVGAYGGGVDPGEDPAESAAREYLEEAGYKLKNLQPLDIAPFRQRWLKADMQYDKIRQRAKEFPGGTVTRTYVADIVGKPQKAIDAQNHWLTDVKPRGLDELLELQRQAVNATTKASPDRRRIEYRMRVLEALANNKTASADLLTKDELNHIISRMPAEDIRAIGFMPHPKTTSDWIRRGARAIRNSEGVPIGFHVPDAGRLGAVYVDPNYRKQGLAEQAIKNYVNELAPGTELKSSARVSNAASRAMHAKAGFDVKKKRKGWVDYVKSAALKLPEFAPGIPIERKTFKVPKVKNQTWDLSIQKHVADKAGPHWDVRLVDPKTQHAHSFAVPKARFPKKKDKLLLAIQQPTHTADYAMKFEGQIPKGQYGAGSVVSAVKEKVHVIKANANKIHFQMKNGKEFTLFRTRDTRWGFRQRKK